MPKVFSAEVPADIGSKLHLPFRHSEEAALTRPFSFVTLRFRTLLLILLSVDFAFILINVVAVVAKDAHLISSVPTMLKITEDRALPEDFNYLKWLVICVALVWTSLRDRWLAPVLWAVVFLIILVDDSFQLHERVGSSLSGWFELHDSALFDGKDIGELAVFAAMGLLSLSIVAVLLRQRDHASRLLSRRYLLIVLILGFFGVGIDAVHSVIAHQTYGTSITTVLSQLLGMVEDGGEMLVASLAVALTLAPVGSRATPSPLHA